MKNTKNAVTPNWLLQILEILIMIFKYLTKSDTERITNYASMSPKQLNKILKTTSGVDKKAIELILKHRPK